MRNNNIIIMFSNLALSLIFAHYSLKQVSDGAVRWLSKLLIYTCHDVPHSSSARQREMKLAVGERGLWRRINNGDMESRAETSIWDSWANLYQIMWCFDQPLKHHEWLTAATTQFTLVRFLGLSWVCWPTLIFTSFSQIYLIIHEIFCKQYKQTNRHRLR